MQQTGEETLRPEREACVRVAEYVWRMWRTLYTPPGSLWGHSGFWYVISEIPVYLCVACCPCAMFQLERARRARTVRLESGITCVDRVGGQDEGSTTATAAMMVAASFDANKRTFGGTELFCIRCKNRPACRTWANPTRSLRFAAIDGKKSVRPFR